MSRTLLCVLAACSFVGVTVAPISYASGQIVGYVSYDVTSPNTAQIDIVNETGPNSSAPDPTFPVTNSITLSDLSLVVTFATGPTETFGPSYFTLDSDGLSFDGTALSTTTGQPTGLEGAISATLTGDFSTTTFDVYGSGTETVDPTFSATITDPSGPLTDGDFALITATAATGVNPTPEPESLVLMGTGLLGMAGLRRRRLAVLTRSLLGGRFGGRAVLAIAGLLLASAGASAQVKMNVDSSPSSGQAGVTTPFITGTGFPSGAISPSAVTMSFSTTCDGTAVATESPNTVSALIGTSDRMQFLVPASLTTGTYYISIAGTSALGTSFSSSAGSCSAISVTATTTELAACVPTSSLAVTVGTNVNAYVPFGFWESDTTGLEEVPLEGTGTAQHFTTTGTVNSCASNSVTGEVICTENGTNVDVINGSTLTTITSASNVDAGFSGGNCENCGVAINSVNNTALIAMGYYNGTDDTAVQVLNLTNNSFNAPSPLAHYVSEDISVDPGRNLVLSPTEYGYYDLLQIGSGNTLTEYGNEIEGALDSAAEDCTTGIALSSSEGTDEVYITDLTQATFTPGSPGTWTAPGKFIDLDDDGYSAGTCGLSSAPGTGHLAVVTGEFGGQSYSALLLPSTSGSGTPTLADYAYVETMPDTPDGNGFSAGYDPHTVTAYTSPNTGLSYAVFADYATYYSVGQPSYLAVVDLACVLGQPRTAGTHLVVGTASACTRYVAVP